MAGRTPMAADRRPSARKAVFLALQIVVVVQGLLLLVQAVMQLVRLDAGAKDRYVKLRNRIKRSKARVAMVWHLAVAIWHMAGTGESYRATGKPEKKVRAKRTPTPPVAAE